MANRQVIFPKTRTTRRLTKMVPVTIGTGTGHTSVHDGQEEIYYEVSIDLDAMHHMARKAAGNKSWKAKDGALQVRVLATKRIEEN